MSFSQLRFGDIFYQSQKNGLTRPKKVRGAGVPMVNMGELFAHPRIRNLSMDRVPLAESESAFLLTQGDLLFARQSLVLAGAGQCSIFLGNNEPTTFESHLIRCRLDRKRVNPSFYFNFFRSPEGRRAIEAIAEQGAGASGIRGSDLINVLVPCPPLHVQNEIAATLDGLDDRITLLRETNATLETIAQAIFKSWFVDFDPVRAKQEGRAPEGMDEATAALFPDSFEESALGLVPRGWKIRKVNELLVRLSAKVRYTKDQVLSSGATPVYEQGAGILLGYHNGTAQFPATPNEPIFIFGDHTCVTHLSCEPFDISMNVIPLKGSERSTLWAYYAVKDKQSFQEYRRHWMELAIKEVVVAPEDLCDRFSIIASSLHVKMESNTWQANTLATLRDTLLPRLISGQLRLPDAQDAIAESAA